MRNTKILSIVLFVILGCNTICFGKVTEKDDIVDSWVLETTLPLYETLRLDLCREIRVRVSNYEIASPPYKKPFVAKLPEYLVAVLLEDLKKATQATGISCITGYELVFSLSDGSEKQIELSPDCGFIRSSITDSGNEYAFDYILSSEVSENILTFVQQNDPEFQGN